MASDLAAELDGWLAVPRTAQDLVQLGWILPVATPLGAFLTAGTLGFGLRSQGNSGNGVASGRSCRPMSRSRWRRSFHESLKISGWHPSRTSVSVGAFLRSARIHPTHKTDAPAALVAQLNEYLHAMVDCILAEGGAVQKFIGDAVLAVWGDTHSTGEAGDASRAVAAALAMEAALAT